MSGILFVSIVIGIVVLAWASLVYIWPAAAKARFVEQVSKLRDHVDDAIIEGSIPDTADVRLYVSKADALVERPSQISISLLLAIHTVCEERSAELDRPLVTYAELTPEQRKFMHEQESAMVDVLTSYLVTGSRFALPLWCGKKVHHSSKRVRLTVKQVPKPSELASEFTRVRNPRPFQRV